MYSQVLILHLVLTTNIVQGISLATGQRSMAIYWTWQVLFSVSRLQETDAETFLRNLLHSFQ